jgi:asparaginyl-tRNA synthetase
VTGTLVASVGRKQSVEIHLPTVVVVGECDETYPMQKQGLPIEFLRENLHLRSRTNITSSTMRIRNRLTMAVHNYFQENGFINVHTPIISSLDCEGAGELFRISSSTDKIGEPQYFGVDETFLTVSGQLHAEIFACSMSKVYTFGPTFRAEKSSTTRHLSEFWMIEPEIAHASINDVMGHSTNLIKYAVKDCLENSKEDMEFFTKWVRGTNENNVNTLQDIVDQPFAVLTYTEAIKILQNNKKTIQWGADLQREDELFLCENYAKKPIYIINWPKSIKPFYMRTNDEGNTVEGFDLLVPQIGELVGGSIREERYDVLIQKMKDQNLNMKDYEWYSDLRKYGTVPHGGFGIGFERLIQFVTGVKNIKDTIPLPRSFGECKY